MCFVGKYREPIFWVVENFFDIEAVVEFIIPLLLHLLC